MDAYSIARPASFVASLGAIYPLLTSRIPPLASRLSPLPMIDLRYVKKLVEMLDESSVDSIEISSDKGMKIRISKSPHQRGAMQVSPSAVMPAIIPAAAPLPVAPAARLSPSDGVPATADGE